MENNVKTTKTNRKTSKKISKLAAHYPDTEGREMPEADPKLTAKQQVAKDKKFLKRAKAKEAKAGKARKYVNKSKLYTGAPIVASRLFVRKMEEFKNCEAWAWMALNEKEGTVTYANSYGPDYGALRASYSAEHYTYPIKEKVVAKKQEEMKELDPVQYPEFFTTAKRRSRK